MKKARYVLSKSDGTLAIEFVSASRQATKEILCGIKVVYPFEIYPFCIIVMFTLPYDVTLFIKQTRLMLEVSIRRLASVYSRRARCM